MNIFELDESIGFLVNKSAQKLKLELARSIKNKGLDISSDQCVVLLHLDKNDGPTQTDLASKLHKDRSNLTRILDVMEKGGLIERRRGSSDRREFNVFITQKGREVIPILESATEDVIDKALDGADKTEIYIVKSFLKKLYKNLEE